jgi:hypothetical protein
MCRPALLILVIVPAAASSLSAAATAPRTLEPRPPLPTYNAVAVSPEATPAAGERTLNDSEESIRSATTTCFRVRRSQRNASITPHHPAALMIRSSGIRITTARRASPATRGRAASLKTNSSRRSDCHRPWTSGGPPGGRVAQILEPGHFSTGRPVAHMRRQVLNSVTPGFYANSGNRLAGHG